MANKPAERMQAEYLERLRRILRRAPAAVREDALREVQTHIEDEWRALGGDAAALQQVLERLGPPEEYGRELALQLMLLGGGERRSFPRLLLAVLFWASTSLIGFPIVLVATLAGGFALGMLFTAIERLRGIPMMLINATSYQVLGYHAERVRFPPMDWSPLLVALVGLLPAAVVFAVVYRFLTQWLHSRLAQRGLELAAGKPGPAIRAGWERRAAAAMAVTAILGLSSCLLFTIISGLAPIGRSGNVSLPEDFFRTPLTALAFLGGLIFLCSPVLGLLWATRRDRPWR